MSVSAFLLNRSSDLFISKRRISCLALLILALLQRIFLMSSLMLLLVWLIFFMVLIKLLPILGTISGKTVKLMVLRSEERFSRNAETDLVCRLLLEKKKAKEPRRSDRHLT